MAKARISIGTWAYLFNQDVPTTDFHQILHKLQDLGYDGVELALMPGYHADPAKRSAADRADLRKRLADAALAPLVARLGKLGGAAGDMPAVDEVLGHGVSPIRAPHAGRKSRSKDALRRGRPIGFQLDPMTKGLWIVRRPSTTSPSCRSSDQKVVQPSFRAAAIIIAS